MANPNSLVISGARIRLYINNRIYSVTQSVSLTQTTGEYEIFGINSPYPQEIAGGGQISVKGSVKGVRTSNSGGIQGMNARPLFSDAAASSYITLRMDDRRTSENIFSIPKCKISNISESVSAKGVYSASFDFIGQILFWPLDLS